MILKTYEIQKKYKSINEKDIFLLYGENMGLKKDIKELILKEIKKNNANLEIVLLDENEILKSEEHFHNLFYSKSLFHDKRALIINRGTDKFLKNLEKITQKNPNKVVLIITSEILEKKSKLRNYCEKNENIFCIPCYEDLSRDLEFIAVKEFKNRNIDISREAINLIINRASGDRYNLKNEIEKIGLFLGSENKISYSQVKELTNSTESIKLEHLVNSCMSGDSLHFRKILSEIYFDTINYIMILKLFSRKIEKLINIKKLEKKFSNIEILINQTKPPIFWKEKPLIKKQLKIWKLKDLIALIRELNIVELQCKKNNNSSSIIFSKFIVDICRRANSYS